MDPHTISCVISRITGQKTLAWSTTTAIGTLDIDQGTYVSGSNSQTTVLSLTAAQLKTLRDTGTHDHVFTCKYMVESSDITATQTVSVYTPGGLFKFCVTGYMTFRCRTTRASIFRMLAYFSMDEAKCYTINIFMDRMELFIFLTRHFSCGTDPKNFDCLHNGHAHNFLRVLRDSRTNDCSMDTWNNGQ